MLLLDIIVMKSPTIFSKFRLGKDAVHKDLVFILIDRVHKMFGMINMTSKYIDYFVSDMPYRIYIIK